MRPVQKEINWSSEITYVVGLITTDGNLSSDGRHFDFTSNDIQLIETFKKCLSLKNKISRKWSTFNKAKTSLHIQFGNITLYKWMLKIGLMPNKSKRIGSLNIPDEYFFDFLRGHLDGDGTIRKYFDPVYKNSLRLYISFMSASIRHLEWLNNSIKRLTGMSGFYRKSNSAFTLTFSKHNSIKLTNLLYYKGDLPRLERKFIIAKEFVRPGGEIG